MQFPFIIGVGAAKSGAGKTTLIENLIKYLKLKNIKNHVTAIKYSKNSMDSNIIIDPSITDIENKDTDRMRKAGADNVYWVRAREEDLIEITHKLREEIFSHIQNDKRQRIIIIEGNSLVRAMQPDVIIFLKDLPCEYIKPSGKATLEIADIVIDRNYIMEEVMTDIEKIQQKRLIEKFLTERSNNGKITCSEARKIAEDLNVPYIEVGRMANELKIKIKKCELGCF